MRKKFGLFALCLSLMLTACSMPAIGSQGNDAGSRQEEEDDEEEIVIELSDKKVELEAGEEFEVEIENYDDLSKVKIEVEDEDIAEADIDDEIITITAVSEGKTKIIVSAKGCDDVKITVKVTAPPVPEPVTEFPEADRYVCKVELTKDVWREIIGFPDDELDEVVEFFAGLNISLNFYLEFTPSSDTEGAAVLGFDMAQFGKDLAEAMDVDENYLQFIGLIADMEGDTLDESIIDTYLEYKDEMVEAISEDIVGDAEEYSYDLTYTIDYPTLYLTGEGETRECTIYDTGTFLLYLDGEDMDGAFFENGLTMMFEPEK